jgi:hypothetical protein
MPRTKPPVICFCGISMRWTTTYLGHQRRIAPRILFLVSSFNTISKRKMTTVFITKAVPAIMTNCKTVQTKLQQRCNGKNIIRL